MIQDGYKETISAVGESPKNPCVQFSLNQLIISPFDAEKVYDTHGSWTWQPIARNLTPTGIRVLDIYLLWLSHGLGDTYRFCRLQSINPTHLNGLVKILTGYTCQQLQQHIHMRIASQLLLFTLMPIKDIIVRCGIRSRTAFSRDYTAYWGISPKEIRKTVSAETMRVAEITETI